MTFDEIVHAPQYSLRQADKEGVLFEHLKQLTHHHYDRSREYRRLLDGAFPHWLEMTRVSDVPVVPVGLFKSHQLQSIDQRDLFKVLLSSGTTTQQPSRIHLDRETAHRQTMALGRIMTHVLGPRRLPMILVETPNVIRDRRQFNARGAGLLGMMNFGSNHFYALDDSFELDRDGLLAFLQRFGGEPFLIFGFTFMVWKYFLDAVAHAGLDLSHGILVHGGGWKRLQEEAVSAEVFRQRFHQQTGLRSIYNFYGMVEQVGSVFLEGEDGYLYAPTFGDVLIRDPRTFEELPVGEVGLIQVVSALPLSYPGHSLLTEDLGVVHTIDAGAGGRMGKAFSVLGRVARAELRGCSDVIAAQVEA